MSTDNLALAERIDTLCKGKLDTFALVKLEGYALEAARALRESAQREAELRILADAGKSWHDAETALRLRAITAERAIATAQAEGFRRGVEACIQEARATAERFRAAGNGEGASDGAPESFYVESMRHAYGAECAAQAIREALLPPPTGADDRAAFNTLLSKYVDGVTGAATETHEFVPSHVGIDYCLHSFDGAHVCGEQRSHPIHHGGR